MKNVRRLAVAGACFGLALLLASCFLKREEGENRTILKAGLQVADDMAGWVALPNSEPKSVSQKDLSYYVLSTHNIVPARLAGWYAMNPALFEKTTKIKPPSQNTPESELWQMRPGRRVPKEKDGWIGVPLTYPQITKQGQDALAVMVADQVIPKEMDGWVAIDKDAMARFAEAKQMSLVNEPEKPPIQDAGKLKGQTSPPDRKK